MPDAKFDPESSGFVSSHLRAWCGSEIKLRRVDTEHTFLSSTVSRYLVHLLIGYVFVRACLMLSSTPYFREYLVGIMFHAGGCP